MRHPVMYIFEQSKVFYFDAYDFIMFMALVDSRQNNRHDYHHDQQYYDKIYTTHGEKFHFWWRFPQNSKG